MKRLASVLGILMVFAVLAMVPSGCSDSDSGSSTSGNLSTRVNLIFAESGTLTPVVESSGAGTESAADQSRKYTLTLENVLEEVLWYTDRPDRKSGSEAVETYIALWSKMYGAVSPNAVLDVYIKGEASNDGLFLMLETPNYDSDSGRLTFQATLLDATTDDIPTDVPLDMDNIKMTVLDNSPEDETDNWSFAQVAPHAFFEPTQTGGVYKLYLEDVYPESYYIGNAPNRRSYLYTVACFVTNWQDIFEDDPPNASMTSYTDEGVLKVQMLTIDDPEYDKDTNTVIYTATLLHGVIGDQQALYSPTLFIDKAPAATHTIQVTNNCTETVWLGACGNAKTGGGYFDPPKGANVELGAGHKAVFHVDKGWQGRFWPRTGCTFGKDGLCKDGGVDCCAAGGCLSKDHKFAKGCYYSGNPPVLTIEAAFDQPSGKDGKVPIDYFDSSMVDGFNVIMSITAIAGTYNKSPDPGMDKTYWCTTAGCSSSPACPKFLKDSKGRCWSPCHYAVNNNLSIEEQERLCCVCSMTNPDCTCPDTCCEGHYGCSPYTPEGKANPNMCCDPWGKLDNNRPWAQKYVDYIDAVKNACPEVYAWQFDDFKSTINCRKTNGLVDYKLTICP